MKTSHATTALLFTTILGAPQATRAQNDPAIADPALSEAAAVPTQTVSPADVLKMLDDKRANVALVDTQPTDGYADLHIPGAINYPSVMRIKAFPIQLPRNKTRVFYGSCPNDTSDIVKQLAEFGYFDVKIMDGGLEEWMSLKYPAAGTSSVAQPHPEVSQVTAKPDKPAAR